MSIDTRAPLTFPTEAQAMDYFRTHGEDIGRPYKVVGYQVADHTGVWPPREALGFNAAGAWVWADEAEGCWP